MATRSSIPIATAGALLVATHNADLAGRADYTLRLHNGVVEPV